MESQKQQHRLDSSTEELTLEQRLLLSSSKRQEPQGEEHTHTCGRKGHPGSLSLERSAKSMTMANTRPETPPSSISSTTSSSSSVYDEDEDPSSHSNSAKKNSQSGATAGGTCGSGPRKNRNMSLDSNSHSTYNTLIIHQNTSSLLADTWIPASHEFTSVGMGNKSNQRGGTGTGGGVSVSPATSGGNQSSIQNNSSPLTRNSPSPSRGTTTSQDHHTNNNSQSSNQSYRKTPPNPYENIALSDQGNNSGNTTTSSELSDIPKDYLNQLTVLKHLAKQVQQDPISGTSPGDLLRSSSFSRSQPDLTQSVGLSMVGGPPSPYYGYDNERATATASSSSSSRPEPQQPQTRKLKKQSGTSTVSRNTNSPSKEPRHFQSAAAAQNEEILPSVQILEILMRENSNLKAELVNARRKISTIHKLEAELSRLQASHSALFESAERRESLERSARVKLSSELKRLTAVNRELLSSSTSLQNLSPNPLGSDVEILRRELSNKDFTLAQLLSQNKDLTTTKERQEVELSAQRATLAEQRTHIEILDAALTSAQGNVLRLEEECVKKQEYVDKASNLQRALSSLQLSNEKREQSEKKLRAQLETEITDLKLRLASMNANESPNPPTMCWNMSQNQQSPGRGCQSPPPYPGAGQSQSHNHRNYENSNEGQLKLLQDKLKASEEHILNLNTQVSKWEHVFSPDNNGGNNNNGGSSGGYRKHSVSTPNTPNSWTNSTSRGGTPHFFSGHHSEKTSSDELLSLSQTHHRANDLEWKIKDLESRLVEKDALIRILQSVPNSPAGSSPLLFSSSNSSSMPMMSAAAPPIYRDSPGYSLASTVVASGGSGFTPNSSGGSGINVSMASMLDQHYANVQHTNNMNMATQAAQQLYAKLGQKCESEPPNYANLPLKLRLGGSGSSLVKNSNESLQSGGGGGVSPNISGPGSVSSTSGASGCGGVGGKSIDDQLKELDTQLLSKGGPGSLKIHSGLCCIPGFSQSKLSNNSYSGPTTRKGKISQPLLESLNGMQGQGQCGGGGTNASGTYSIANGSGAQYPGVMVRTSAVSGRQSSNNNTGGGSGVLPPLPKPPSTYQTQSHGSQGQTRTSSGPPFLSPASAAALSAMNSSMTTTMSLSNSVDSVLSDQSPGKNTGGGVGGNVNVNVKTGGNIFTPAVGMPKGLPPKSPPGIVDNNSSGGSGAGAGKSRSLERNKPCANEHNGAGGKYTVMMYDQTRCRSLDRREAKKEKAEKNLQSQSQEKKAEKEKGNLKSSVGLKAAFFGQLLSRRSPSPAREKEKDKDKEKIEKESRVRILNSENKEGKQQQQPLGNSKGQQSTEKSEFEADLDALLLDKQGRSSQTQRNRISSKWSSSNTLESVMEQSPCSQRKNSEGGGNNCTASEGQSQKNKEEKVESEESGKKWGRIVKTPFGLRYTFGSPRIASSDNFGK